MRVDAVSDPTEPTEEKFSHSEIQSESINYEYGLQLESMRVDAVSDPTEPTEEKFSHSEIQSESMNYEYGLQYS